MVKKRNPLWIPDNPEKNAGVCPEDRQWVDRHLGNVGQFLDFVIKSFN